MHRPERKLGLRVLWSVRGASQTSFPEHGSEASLFNAWMDRVLGELLINVFVDQYLSQWPCFCRWYSNPYCIIIVKIKINLRSHWRVWWWLSRLCTRKQSLCDFRSPGPRLSKVLVFGRLLYKTVQSVHDCGEVLFLTFRLTFASSLP